MGHACFAAFVAAGALAVMLPSAGGAATSGGWSNLGPGFHATLGPISGKVNVLERSGQNM